MTSMSASTVYAFLLVKHFSSSNRRGFWRASYTKKSYTGVLGEGFGRNVGFDNWFLHFLDINTCISAASSVIHILISLFLFPANFPLLRILGWVFWSQKPRLSYFPKTIEATRSTIAKRRSKGRRWNRCSNVTTRRRSKKGRLITGPPFEMTGRISSLFVMFYIPYVATDSRRYADYYA
jgi:hypothetical protein